MAQFKVGGKVVCVNSFTATCRKSGQQAEYKRNETYTVIDIFECKCGSVQLCFGQPKTGFGFRNVILCTCGDKRTEGADFFCVNSRHFAPIEEQEYKQVTYTKILDEIPVCAQ